MKSFVDRYGKYYKGIKEIVNRHDIEKLIACGSPDDEYDPEIFDIINRCISQADFGFEEKFKKTVEDIFEFWFGKWEYGGEIKKMSDELYEYIRSLRPHEI